MPGIDECLLEAMLLPGARGAALVDWISGLPIGAVGESPGGDHEITAVETAELARLAGEHHVFTAPAAAGADADVAVEDVVVTTTNGYHLLRFVESPLDTCVVAYLWLDRDEGNLALARLRMRSLAERLVLV
ncbi:hypothetical protein K7472_11815 [Streptomyces sp. PTM05]|uniref:Roadblock/LAMTOR2 domain-containing protein n=1 Tax=Streptantibioticus parmotrematis TaxID=2873249 RepID=A0ABS7QQR5_9ACTN|nr:hypothetical protein [Streptantibioticus parmotrematis]MBY8885532.1 hypothetical protein [Streptantibioticus parmotrematis]